MWFSLLVLIPLAVVIGTGVAGGLERFWAALTNQQTLNAIGLTVGISLVATAVNVVVGTIIAWVLVRDRFWGKSHPQRDHRHPVRPADDRRRAGAAVPVRSRAARWASTSPTPAGPSASRSRSSPCRSSSGPSSPSSRSSMRDVEEAAASLGASSLTTFRRVILPSLFPAITAGAALSFARGISEYGSLVLLSGNLPNRTEVVIGPGAHLHRERRPGLGRRDRDRHAGRRARRDRRPRRDPAKGGPPWFVSLGSSCAGAFAPSPSPTSCMLVLWPVALVVHAHLRRRLRQRSSRHCPIPVVIRGAALTAQVTVWSVAAQPGLRRRDLAPARPLRLPREACAVRAGRPAAVGVAGRRRSRADAGLQPRRTGWFGPSCTASAIQIIFATPGMILATVFVALPLVVREVVPVLDRDRRRPGAGRPQPRRNAAGRRSGGSPCRASSGRSSTASCSALARSLGEFGAVKVVSGNIAAEDPDRHARRRGEVPELRAGHGLRDRLHPRLRGGALHRCRHRSCAPRRSST